MRTIILSLLFLSIKISCWGQFSASVLENEYYLFNPEKYLSLIDSQIVSTGILIDKSIYDSIILNINGYDKVTTVYSGDYYKIYRNLKRGSYDKSSFFDVDIIKEVRNNYFYSDYATPISILDFSFNRIKQEALDNNILIENDSILYANGADATAFSTHRAIVASCITYNIFDNGNVRFVIPEYLMFSNNQEEIIKHIEIDFDDGIGYRYINLNEIITLNYPPEAKHYEAKVKLTFENFETSEDIIYYSHFSFLKMAKSTAPTPNINLYFPSSYDTSGSTGKKGIQFTIIFNPSNNSGKIRRPLVISDGFDHGNKRNYFTTHLSDTSNVLLGADYGLYQKFNGDPTFWEPESSADLFSYVRNLGYDIVFIDYHWGSGPIDKNAATLRRFFNEALNGPNFRDNKTEEIIYVGASMGGLISRYAIREMELNNEDHYVKTWISFDSPNKGAYIPIGLQWLIRHFSPYNSDAKKGLEELNSEAARQMLIYHYTNPTDDIGVENFTPGPYIAGSGEANFPNFYDKLDQLGYPLFPKNYAISNGGRSKLYPNSGEQIIDYDDKDISAAFSFGKAWGCKSSTSTNLIYRGRVSLGLTRNKHTTTSLPFENSPGGYITSLYDINFSKNNEITHDISDPRVTKSTFMPTSTAFGITITSSTINKRHVDYTNRNDLASGLQRTPFDKIHGMNNNEDHCNISIATRNYVINEFIEDFDNTVRPRERLTYGSGPIQHQTMHQKVSGKVAYTVKENIRFCSSENDNTFTVEPGADVTVTAGAQIRLLPGFHAKAGSKFHAKIDPDIDYGTLLEPKTGEAAPLATIEGYSHAGKVYDYSTGSYYNSKNNKQTLDSKETPFSVNIYPNPATNIVNVEVFGLDEVFASLEIYNTMGNLIRKETIENNGIFGINVSNFTQGIYYFRIIYKSAVISEKIIKL